MEIILTIIRFVQCSSQTSEFRFSKETKDEEKEREFQDFHAVDNLIQHAMGWEPKTKKKSAVTFMIQYSSG